MPFNPIPAIVGNSTTPPNSNIKATVLYEHEIVMSMMEAEREACAKVCVDLASEYITAGHPLGEIAAKAAAIGATRIRARGAAGFIKGFEEQEKK